MEVQTRQLTGAIIQHSSLKEAFDFANANGYVWKVSFNAEDGTRCRFTRYNSNKPAWMFDPIEIQVI